MKTIYITKALCYAHESKKVGARMIGRHFISKLKSGVTTGTLWTLICLLVSGCQETATAVLGSQLRATQTGLIDEQGREVFMRGLNARIEGLFDVTFNDGRVALQPIPPFGKEDLIFLKEEMGMNALRIPINWSGLEPLTPGHFDTAYLSQLDTLLDDCAETKMWCLVDLHQDAYSKEIGEDGAPLWAIMPPPTRIARRPSQRFGGATY